MANTKTKLHKNIESIRPIISIYTDKCFTTFEKQIIDFIYHGLEIANQLDTESMPAKKKLFFKIKYNQDTLNIPQTLTIEILSQNPHDSIEILDCDTSNPDILHTYEILLTENAFYHYKKAKLRPLLLSSFYLFRQCRYDLLCISNNFMESFITYTMPELKDPKNDLLADWMKKHMDKDDRLPLNTLFKAKIPFSKATASLFAFVFGNFFPKDDFAFLVDCRVMDIFIPQDLLSIAEKDIQLTDKKIYLMPDNIQYSRITYEDSKRHNGYKGQSTFFAKWINEIAYIQVNLDELSPFVRQKFIGTYHFFEICANENILNETLIELLEDMDRYQVLESLDLETSETLTQITQDKQIYIAKA